MIVLYFPTYGFHFQTTLRVLKSVLVFQMKSFNYGTKGVRDVDPTCRCHQVNIIPDSLFSINVPQCVTTTHKIVCCDKTYKIGCSHRFVTQPCTEVDDNPMCWQTKLHTWDYHITLINMLYLVRVQYLLFFHSWDR